MACSDSTRRMRMRARILTVAALAVAVVLAAPVVAHAGGAKHNTTATSTAASTTGLFASSSVWNAPLAADAPLDASSSARSAALLAEVRREISAGTGPWIDEKQYSTPLYTVPGNQPKVRVKLDNGASWALPLATVLAQGVPIPPGAKPAAGTDGYMTVYQPSTDTMWEFWRASLKSDGWHASWGGAMQHVSTNPGHYSNLAWSGLPTWAGWNWGATASSLPVIGGVAMIKELQAGHIDHALALDVPVPCQGMFSWPAQRTDGTSTDANCIPEGAHLRVDPNLDLSKLTMPPITRMLAEAAQKYGMIVRDRTGEAVDFFAEDPTPTGTDPYNGPDGIYGGLRPWNFMPKFPWASVQLLKMTPCTKAPCLPVTQ
jgi:hypothetical protein